MRDCFLNTSLFFCQLQLISFSYLGNDSSAVLRRLPSNLAFSLEVLLNQFLLLFGIVALSVRLGQVFILACVESLQTHLVDFLQNLRSVIDTQLFEKLLDVGRGFTRHCSLRRSERSQCFVDAFLTWKVGDYGSCRLWEGVWVEFVDATSFTVDLHVDSATHLNVCTRMTEGRSTVMGTLVCEHVWLSLVVPCGSDRR